MKRLFLTLLTLIIILSIGATYIIMFRIGPTVENAVKTVLPEVFGTEVTIGSMNVLPLQGTVQLHDVKIANPSDKYLNPIAAEAKEIRFTIEIRTALSKTLEFKEIQIIDPVFNYEHRHGRDNLDALHKNLTDYFAKRKANKTEAERQASEENPHKAIIDLFVVSQGKVNAKIIRLPTATIPLPDIKLENIGKDINGERWAAIGIEISSAIHDDIVDVVTNIRSMARIAIKGTGHAVLGTGHTAFTHATDAGGTVIGVVADAGDAVIDTAIHPLHRLSSFFKHHTEDEGDTDN